MNKVILTGRLVREPELKFVGEGIAVTRFTVAVDRKYKKDGEKQADFINCVAWRKTGEFIANYFTKGSGISIVGNIQTRTYTDKEGNNRSITEVIVDDVEFAGGKKQEQPNLKSDVNGYTQDEGYEPVEDEDMPF